MSKVISPKFRMSYANVVVPVAGTDDDGNATEEQYSVCCVFTKQDDLTAIRKAIAEVVVEKFGQEKAREILGKMVPGGSIKNPLRSDVEGKYGEANEHLFMNARNKIKPQIAHPYAGTDGKPKLMTDEEAKELCYSGAYARASLKFFWFDKKGNKGVGCSLNNVQWLGHGERLDNRTKAQDDFDVVEAAEGVSDLASLI